MGEVVQVFLQLDHGMSFLSLNP